MLGSQVKYCVDFLHDEIVGLINVQQIPDENYHEWTVFDLLIDYLYPMLMNQVDKKV
jgi:hypothetical protein